MTPQNSIPLSMVVAFAIVCAVLAAAATSNLVIRSGFPQTSSSLAQEISDPAQQGTDSSSSSAADDNTPTNTNTQSLDVDLEQDVEAEVEDEANQATDNVKLIGLGGGSDHSYKCKYNAFSKCG